MDRNSSEKPIALFDSGVGGLTVFKELKVLLPHENYIYFGDTLNMPYGEKTSDELLEITSKIFDFFALKDVKAVVMACNTTSAICYESLKNKYDFKIYPVVQSVSKVLSELNVNRIGVFATPATVNSHAYAKNIEGKDVFEVGCPDWVKIVENNLAGMPESREKVRIKTDEMLKFAPEKIVLGCTHYPYLTNLIGEFYPEKDLINPAKYFAQFIKNDLASNDLLNEGSVGSEHFYVSSNPEQFKISAKMFCELAGMPELIRL